MPMLILGTSVQPALPYDFETAAHDTGRRLSMMNDSSNPIVTPVDVRGDEFFRANCHMANSLIEATRNKTYALGVDSFVSATFHGEDKEHGGVECLSSRLINAVRTNYISKNVLLTHTSEN